MELREQALLALCCPVVEDKRRRVAALWLAWQGGELALDAARPLHAGTVLARHAEAAGWCLPGRPTRPLLVPPAQVPQRPVGTLAGRAALLHAICHIEFNAINLALDAIWRFEGLPADYYRDWLLVADEESRHFGLLADWLAARGQAYGDFEAHDGLWAMCEQTAADPVARMALVPRLLEARGLDATPLIQQRLRAVAREDARQASAILDTILRDEVGHVAIGNHWYRWLCGRDGLDPLAHEAELMRAHRAPRLRPPFNRDARERAGFTAEELERLGEGPLGPSAT